jgi:hypothetical protein
LLKATSCIVVLDNSFHTPQLFKNPYAPEWMKVLSPVISYDDLLYIAFNSVFVSYTDRLKNYLRNTCFSHRLRPGSTSRVGVHMRIGHDPSITWEDPSRHGLSEVSCFVKQTVKLCKGNHAEGHSAPCEIYIASDSPRALELFQESISKRYPEAKVLVGTGNISHVDKVPVGYHTSDVATFDRVFGDWACLSQSDIVVFSNSYFGKSAAAAAAIPLRPGYEGC